MWRLRFGLCGMFDDLENLLEPLRPVRGLRRLVCFSRRRPFQSFRLGSFRSAIFGRTGDDLLFRRVDVFQVHGPRERFLLASFFFWPLGIVLDCFSCRGSQARGSREVSGGGHLSVDSELAAIFLPMPR